MLTHAQIIANILGILRDEANIFAVEHLDLLVPPALAEISRFRPRQTKETLTTTADSYDLTLGTENKRKLLWIEALEYEVDQDPKEFRNFTRWGDTVTIDLASAPEDDDESVYLYLAKEHILQKEIGTSDVSGKVATQAEVGDTTLALDNLGTGTINEDTQLVITGDTTATTYTVTATATIAANAATVSITPAIAEQALAAAVVTLSVHASTLDYDLERLLAELVAARAAVSKADYFYAQGHSAIAILTTAETALAAMSGQLTLAIAAVVAGGTELAKSIGFLTTAGTVLSSVDAEVAQALADLDTGRALIPTTPIGSGPGMYSQYAQGDIINARGYIEEALGYIGQAQADEHVSGSFLQKAAADIQVANTYLNQGIGYLRDIAARLSISSSGRHMEAWGQTKLILVLKELPRLARPRYSETYSRS